MPAMETFVAVEEVSASLAHDLRQGAHARKVMESYQTWFGEGPELAILRMLGLFDRPVDEQTFNVLPKAPAIPGLTESLTDLRPTEWQTILAKLRRTKLLAREDAQNLGQLDTHPGDGAAFLSRIRGCNAGLFREALHEVYRPRIQRGNTCFAANVLGARGPLLSVLVHFFEHGRWGLPVQAAIDGQSLKTAIGVPNCTGFAVCFSRLLALMRYKSRPRSAKPLKSQKRRSRFP
jgi:hypothetical protein